MFDLHLKYVQRLLMEKVLIIRKENLTTCIKNNCVILINFRNALKLFNFYKKKLTCFWKCKNEFYTINF